jgi:ribonuclease P protein component
MSPEKNSFNKAERLCSKKIFAELFKSGNSFYSFPFRVVWMCKPDAHSSPSRIAVSVPKRIFKKAVDRNLIRRRIKEAFRKNKHDLYSLLETTGKQIVFVLIYQDNKIHNYKKNEKYVVEMLKKFITTLK